MKPEVVEDMKAEAAAEEARRRSRGREEKQEKKPEEKKDEEMREAPEAPQAPEDLLEVAEAQEESFYHEGVEYTAKESSLKRTTSSLQRVRSEDNRKQEAVAEEVSHSSQRRQAQHAV